MANQHTPGLGLHVSVIQLQDEALALNAELENKAPQVAECIMAMEDFCNDISLSGRGYDEARRYYETVHIPIYEQLESLVTGLQAANLKMLEILESEAPNVGESFYAVIEEEIELLEAEIAQFRALCNSVPIDEYGAEYYSIFVHWCEEMIAHMEEEIRVLEGILREMEAFNNSGSQAYENVETQREMLAAMAEALRSGEMSVGDAATAFLVPYKASFMVDADGNLNKEYIGDVMAKDPSEVTPVEYAALCVVVDGIPLPGGEGQMEEFMGCCYGEAKNESVMYGTDIAYYTTYELSPVAGLFANIYTQWTQEELANNTSFDLAAGGIGTEEHSARVARAGIIGGMAAGGDIVCAGMRSGPNDYAPLGIHVKPSSQVEPLSLPGRIRDHRTDVAVNGEVRPYDYVVSIDGYGAEAGKETLRVGTPMNAPTWSYYVDQMVDGDSERAKLMCDRFENEALMRHRPKVSLGKNVLDEIVGFGFSTLDGEIKGDIPMHPAGKTVIGICVNIGKNYINDKTLAAEMDRVLGAKSEFDGMYRIGQDFAPVVYSDGSIGVTATHYNDANEAAFRAWAESEKGVDALAAAGYTNDSATIDQLVESVRGNSCDYGDYLWAEFSKREDFVA